MSLVLTRSIMRLLLLLFFFLPKVILSQQIVVDSVELKLEKYYNPALSDSARASYKSKIVHMDKYIAQDSVNAAAFLQRGIYYSFLGLSVEAIKNYNKSLGLDNQQPIAYFNRGVAKARFKFTYEACYDFKKAHMLGLSKAAEVYNTNCQLHKKRIDSLVSKNWELLSKKAG